MDFEDRAVAELAVRARDAGAKRLRRAAVGGGRLDAHRVPVPANLVRLPPEGVRLEQRAVRDLEVAAWERAVVLGEKLADLLL